MQKIFHCENKMIEICLPDRDGKKTARDILSRAVEFIPFLFYYGSNF